jgi:hypothetical protein
MARIERTPIEELARQDFRNCTDGRFTDPLEGTKAKETRAIERWMAQTRSEFESNLESIFDHA